MNWQASGQRDPPSVVFILRLFGNGWTTEQVLESYPQLTPAALQAVLAFAQQRSGAG